MNMASGLCGWLGTLSCALTLGFLVPPARVAAEAPPASPVKAEEMETVTVAQLLIDIPSLGDLGYVKEGYRVAFLNRLRALGYPALGAEDLAFQKDHSDRARFVIGGTLNGFECDGSYSPSCRLGVEWKLLDRRTDEVVYKVQVQYHGYRMVGDSAARAKQLLDGAFERLLARSAFAGALKKQDSAAPQVAYPAALVTRCPRPAIVMPGDAQQALDAVVLLHASQSFGSGVVISPDGLALTAAHVIDGQQVTARYRDGSERKVTPLRIHRDQDVALVRIEQAPATCMPAAEQEPGMGADIYAIGSPASTELSFTLTRGIVSGSREWQGQRFLQTDASVNSGHSGGPLLDDTGRLAAIISWKIQGTGIEGVSFGVPLDAALKALGLSYAEQAEPIVAAITEPAKAPVVVDEADKKLSLRPELDRQRAWRAATPPYVKFMRVGGLLLASAGTMAVATTFARYRIGDPDYDEFKTMRAWNTGGWVALGVGVGAYVTHFFLRPPPPGVETAPGAKTDKDAAKPAGKVSATASGFQVRF